jgi:hypothetical protein
MRFVAGVLALTASTMIPACGGRVGGAPVGDAGSQGDVQGPPPVDASVDAAVGADAHGADVSTQVDAGCPASEAFCGATCVDLQTSTNNCGACNNVCTGTCTSGHCLVTLASGQGAVAIAVDATSVYWANQGPNNNSVMKMGLDGGSPTLLASPTGALWAIAVDATSVYFASGSASSNAVAIMSVPLDGIVDGGSPMTLASGQSAQAMTVDANSVYWPNPVSGTVVKDALDGGNPTTLASNQGAPQDVAVDATSIYWTNVFGSESVMSAPITPVDGGIPLLLASGQSAPHGIAVDSTSAYWTTESGNVMKVPLGGGGSGTMLASGQNQPLAVVVDATNVYWVNQGDNGSNGSVMKVPVVGGGSTVLFPGGGPLAIAQDATSIYWVDGAAGTVMKMSK